MTSPIAVIAVDGVLKDEATGAPIPVGQRLYRSLSELYRLVLVADEPVHKMWLAINGFELHQHLLTRLPEDPDDTGIRRIRQIERIRGMGGTVELLVDPDPLVVPAVTTLGVVCLHYVDPPYARPEFHPTYAEKITPWAQMVEDLDQARVMRAADNRMFEGD